EGYRNNIWWNIAHVVVTQQLLGYKPGGPEMRADNALTEKFNKGTVPDGTATDAEIDLVTRLLFDPGKWAREEYGKGLLNKYNQYTTSVNITLRNVEDAILFNVYHEGMHLGAILALLKALKRDGV